MSGASTEEIKEIFQALNQGRSCLVFKIGKPLNCDEKKPRIQRAKATTRQIPKSEYQEDKKKFDNQVKDSRLAAAGISTIPYDIKVNKSIYSKTVTRRFMANVYGGCPQLVRPAIRAEKVAEHGMEDFMYLSLDYETEAPVFPGSPGLYFTIGKSGGNATAQKWKWGVMRVITRIRKAPALWQYQGQYELKPSRSISQGEWAQQSTYVRKRWIDELFKKPWGGTFRAGVYARKHWERNPTDKESKWIQERGLDRTITKPEIAAAITRGDDTLVVYTMKCVGYDAAFQKQLIAKYPAWQAGIGAAKGTQRPAARKRAIPDSSSDESPNAKRRRTGSGATGTTATTPSQGQRSKRVNVRVIVPEVSDEDDTEEYEPIFIPRGTRSRPAKV